MKSKSKVKPNGLKAVRGGWNPTADDPALRAWAKELAAEFTATTPLVRLQGSFIGHWLSFGLSLKGASRSYCGERTPRMRQRMHRRFGGLRRKARSDLSARAKYGWRQKARSKL